MEHFRHFRVMEGEKISTNIKPAKGETLDVWFDNSNWPVLCFSFVIPAWHWLVNASKFCAEEGIPLSLQSMEAGGAHFYGTIEEIRDEGNGNFFIKLHAISIG